MISEFQRHARFNIPNVLRRGHDDVRAELVRATMEHGPITAAANRLAKLCLPHFEWEEKIVFPALGLLPDLAQGHVRPEMLKVLPLIAEFSASQDALDAQHRSILSAIDALLQAAHREKNAEFAEFAYNLRVHEWVEDEVIFPMVIVIGKYLRERPASLQPEEDHCTAR